MLNMQYTPRNHGNKRMKNRRENSKLTRQMAPLAKAIAVDDAAKLHVLKAWFPPFRCRSAVARFAVPIT